MKRYMVLMFVAAAAACDDGSSGDACDGHDDCSDTNICILSECVPAYGRDYRITIVSATLPETNSSGETWDFPGGLPDAYATFADTDGNSCRTGYVDNTLSPIWNHACSPPFRINATSVYRWRIYDADDVTEDELIAGIPSGSEMPIEVEWIKDGFFYWVDGDTQVTFQIDPM